MGLGFRQGRSEAAHGDGAAGGDSWSEKTRRAADWGGEVRAVVLETEGRVAEAFKWREAADRAGARVAGERDGGSVSARRRRRSRRRQEAKAVVVVGMVGEGQIDGEGAAVRRRG